MIHWGNYERQLFLQALSWHLKIIIRAKCYCHLKTMVRIKLSLWELAIIVLTSRVILSTAANLLLNQSTIHLVILSSTFLGQYSMLIERVASE